MIEMFKVGARCHHIRAGRDVIVERDNGGDTVYVCYVGTGRSQSVPRGVLVLVSVSITSPKSSGSTEKKPPKISTPKIIDPLRQELTMFMREMVDVEMVQITAKNFQIDLDITKQFGMLKMQLMTKLWAKMKAGEITVVNLWEGAAK